MSFFKRNLSGIMGSFLLASTYIMHWKGLSMIFFGEIPFPEE